MMRTRPQGSPDRNRCQAARRGRWTAGLLGVFAIAASAVAFAIASTGAADAQIRQTTRYQHYTVSGRTSLDLVRSMYRNGPRHWGNSYILARIFMQRKFDVKVRRQGSGCRVAGLEQNISFRIILPRMRPSGAMSRHTRRAWTAFVRYLDRHEKTHRKIWLACARRTALRARRLPANPSCDSQRAEVAKIINRIDAVCARQQNDYDRRDSKTTNRQPLMRQAIAQLKRSKSRAVAANRVRGRSSGGQALRAASLRCCD